MTENKKNSKRDWLNIAIWILGAFFVTGLALLYYWYFHRKKKKLEVPKQ